MDTLEKSDMLNKWLDEKSLNDIKQIDLFGIAVDMDFFLIATALNERHAKSTADFIKEKCDENDIAISGVEGTQEGKWILIDCSDVVVHIFTKEERERYALEKLWSEGKMLTFSPKDKQ